MTEFWTPGETHYPTDPAFYPGEVDALWGVNNSAVESAVWAEGGTSATVASPASFIAGGGAWIYEKYDPRPDITQGYWLVRVRGTGTLVFATGVDAASDWDWYYTTQEIAWSSAGTEDVNTAEFTDLHVPITPYMFTQANMEDGTFLLQVEVTSGSVEFDVMDFRCASDYGYHRETGSGQYSEWQDREFYIANQSAGRVSYAESAVLLGSEATVLNYRGMEATPPADTVIRPQVDAVAGQIYGTTPAGTPRPAVNREDPTYYASPGTYYTSGPYNGSSGVLEDRVSQWSWEDYYPGFPLYGWPPRDAWWAWGTHDSTPDPTTPAYERSTMTRGLALSFEPASVTKPSVNVLMADSGLIQGVHYSSGQYEPGVLSDFINWEPQVPDYVDLDDTWFREDPAYAAPPPHAYFVHSTFDNEHGAAVSREEWFAWASAPHVLELRAVIGWQVGDTTPTPGSGVLLGSVSMQPREYMGHETRPYYDASIDYGVLPYETVGLFLFRTGGHAMTTARIEVAPRVLLPRFQFYQPEWEYLGGFVSENGPPLNFVMVTNDC